MVTRAALKLNATGHRLLRLERRQAALEGALRLATQTAITNGGRRGGGQNISSTTTTLQALAESLRAALARGRRAAMHGREAAVLSIKPVLSCAPRVCLFLCFRSAAVAAAIRLW